MMDLEKDLKNLDEATVEQVEVCECGNTLTDKELFYETCLKCEKTIEQTDDEA